MRRSITWAVVRCRFAARPGVKRQRFVETSPEYAAEIDAVRREIPGPLLCTLFRLAYSDESGHLFRFVSDTDPTISDSGRSEATLGREQ